MCGRYFIDDETLVNLENLADRIEQEKLAKISGSHEVFPTHVAPIIANEEEQKVLTAQAWGFPKFDNKGVIINARAESVLEKPTFHTGIRNNRVLIPCLGFYEWDYNKTKISHFRPDGEIMYIAGIFDEFAGEDKYCMLTTAANDSMQDIHHRMPLILEENQFDDWLYDDRSIEHILQMIPTAVDKDSGLEQLTLFDF